MLSPFVKLFRPSLNGNVIPMMYPRLSSTFSLRRTFQIGRHLSQSTADESDLPSKKIVVNYIDREGKRKSITGRENDDVMRLAQRHGIEIEGACEGSIACSTCHVYVDSEHYDTIPPASEEEDDMLDMAPFLKPNSRLGCQIKLNDRLDGITVTLPPVTRNFYVDGHKPEPH